MTETIYAGTMPILALRGLVVFPNQTVHFDVGRKKSTLALEAAMKADQMLLLIPQKDLTVDDPTLADLYSMGTVAKVKQVLKTQGENLRVLVTGLRRAKITEMQQTSPYLSGMVESVPEVLTANGPRNQALGRVANMMFGLYNEMMEHPAQAVQLKLLGCEDDGEMADTIAQNSGIDFPEKVKLLQQLNPTRRLEMCITMLRKEAELLKLEAQIQEKTRLSIDKNQRDYYLREQMKAIREELGEGDDESEIDYYIRKIRELQLAEDVE